VLRGGSWNLDAYYLRSSIRGANSPGNTPFSFGFRVARAP
jgi:formylglycine-generating enzyme required for sulfatase activity